MLSYYSKANQRVQKLLNINTLNNSSMKNLLKMPFLGLALLFSVAACKGKKSSDNTDSAKNAVDSSTTIDTTKHSDTLLKVDTVKKATDTSDMKTDTVSKKISTKTEVKKATLKKAKEQ